MKKTVASNKNQTLPPAPPLASVGAPPIPTQHVNGPGPFIDRISIMLTVPSEFDGHAIHSNIWPQVADTQAFAQIKAPGGFKRAWKLLLPSIADIKKCPHLSYMWVDNIATKLRLEFVPCDLGHQGMLELHANLTAIVDAGWAYFIEHGRITRIDVAVDFPDKDMTCFHFLPQQGATTKEWRSDGRVESFQHGKVKGHHTMVYDRGAKRNAQGKAVDRRAKGTPLAG